MTKKPTCTLVLRCKDGFITDYDNVVSWHIVQKLDCQDTRVVRPDGSVEFFIERTRK